MILFKFYVLFELAEKHIGFTTLHNFYCRLMVNFCYKHHFLVIHKNEMAIPILCLMQKIFSYLLKEVDKKSIILCPTVST